MNCINIIISQKVIIMLFYPLYYDIISLTSLIITNTFNVLLGFVENQGIFWDFKIQNSIWITEGLDNGDLDNRGSTVLLLKLKLQLSCINFFECQQASLPLPKFPHPNYKFKKLAVVLNCRWLMRLIWKLWG